MSSVEFDDAALLEAISKTTLPLVLTQLIARIVFRSFERLGWKEEEFVANREALIYKRNWKNKTCELIYWKNLYCASYQVTLSYEDTRGKKVKELLVFGHGIKRVSLEYELMENDDLIQDYDKHLEFEEGTAFFLKELFRIAKPFNPKRRVTFVK